jgi:hypothetical protein
VVYLAVSTVNPSKLQCTSCFREDLPRDIKQIVFGWKLGIPVWKHFLLGKDWEGVGKNKQLPCCKC